MAHTYVIQSIASVGDVATITGTVDDIPVTIQAWVSAMNQQPNVITLRNYLSSLMLAAAIPPAPVAVVAPNLVAAEGTFTQ